MANFLPGKTALLITKIGIKKTKNAKNQKNIITLKRYEIVLPFSKAANPSNPILLNSCKIIFGPCTKCGNFFARKDGLIDRKNRNNENEKCKKSTKPYNTLVRFLNFDLNLFLFKCF